MFRLAVAQMCSHPYDKNGNLEIMEKLIRRAKNQRADMVVFPELCVTGYSVIADVAKAAEELDGPSTRRLSRLAEEAGLSVVFGIPEKAAEAVYDSAVVVDQAGEARLVYRKMNLWSAEKRVFGRGVAPALFELDGFRFGVGVCYDLEFPEYSRFLALRGADVLLYPSAQPSNCRQRVRIFLRSRALENGVFVAFSDLSGVEGEHSFAGGSCVIGPNGERLAGEVRGEAGIALCSLDRDSIRRERSENPYLEDLALAHTATLQ